METDQFIIEDVRWSYQPSLETGNQERTTVQSATITCKRTECEHKWTATKGNGLIPVVGGIRIECPNCGAEGFAHPS
jgi:hypothetical protein